MFMKLYLARHGETLFNVDNKFSDDPSEKVFLTEKGIEEVVLVSRNLLQSLAVRKNYI